MCEMDEGEEMEKVLEARKLLRPPAEVNLQNFMKRLQPHHKGYLVTTTSAPGGSVSNRRAPLVFVFNFGVIHIEGNSVRSAATYIFLQSQTQCSNLLVRRLQLVRDFQVCAPERQQL